MMRHYLTLCTMALLLACSSHVGATCTMGADDSYSCRRCISHTDWSGDNCKFCETPGDGDDICTASMGASCNNGELRDQLREVGFPTWRTGFRTSSSQCREVESIYDALTAHNNCRYSNDGECDEPRYCATGSDCADCGNCGSAGGHRRSLGDGENTERASADTDAFERP